MRHESASVHVSFAAVGKCSLAHANRGTKGQTTAKHPILTKLLL